MTRPVLQIENLAKRYQLGASASAQVTFREMIYQTLGRLTSKQRSGGKSSNTFWALKDINCQINEGETVGIIGCNGAGKSTLLKILSSITDPTLGRVLMRGHVSSLLEVGTGFHPELTGRENIFLNGAILGMRQSETKRKFDDIVNFAEIENFVDTPVKRYSSGMYVRLAFAVAAHLEPEILIVDEVLAVGDAAFQQRCLGKMKDVARSGRTVLFVSHNLSAIKRLCQRAIWLDHGQVKMDGPSLDVVSQYLNTQTQTQGQHAWPQGYSDPDVDDIKLQAIRILNGRGQVTSRIDCDEPFNIELQYHVLKPITHARIGFVVDTADRELVFETCMEMANQKGHVTPAGQYTTTCQVPGSILAPRRYVVSVTAGIPKGRQLAYRENIIAFDINEPSQQPTDLIHPRKGIVQLDVQWQHHPLAA